MSERNNNNIGELGKWLAITACIVAAAICVATGHESAAGSFIFVAALIGLFA